MKRNHFKLSLVILVGLACYFLALSTVLVASANISRSSGFGDNAGKTLHTGRGLPGHGSANLPYDGNPPPHAPEFQTAGTGGNDDNPCLASIAACDGGTFDQGTDGPAWSGQGPGDSIATNGKGGPFGDRAFPYLASFGFNYFGAGGEGPAPPGGAGGNAGSSQNGGSAGPTASGDLGDGSPPGFTGQGPGGNSPPNEPDVVTSPAISLVFPSDPTGSGNPGTFGGYSSI